MYKCKEMNTYEWVEQLPTKDFVYHTTYIINYKEQHMLNKKE